MISDANILRGSKGTHVQVVVGSRIGLIESDNEGSVRGCNSTRIVPGSEIEVSWERRGRWIVQGSPFKIV